MKLETLSGVISSISGYFKFIFAKKIV